MWQQWDSSLSLSEWSFTICVHTKTLLHPLWSTGWNELNRFTTRHWSSDPLQLEQPIYHWAMFPLIELMVLSYRLFPGNYVKATGIGDMQNMSQLILQIYTSLSYISGIIRAEVIRFRCLLNSTLLFYYESIVSSLMHLCMYVMW